MPIRPRTPPRPAHHGLLRHWSLWVWFALALVLCVGGVAAWKSGRWLVKEDQFDHVGWALVLAGESRDCERTDKAIELFKAGRADTLVLSATRIFKNRYQSEFMVDYVAQQGVPRDRIFEFRQDAYSTLEEARLLVRQFRLQNLDTALIITSSYHTARTRRIFRKLAQGYPVMLVASAEYHVYDPNAWWSNRESRKVWFNEWVKTLFTVYELWKAQPETGKADFQGLTPDIWANGAGPALPVIPPPDSDSAEKGGKDSAEAADAKDGSKEHAADSLWKEATVKLPADTAKAALTHKDSLKAKEAEAKADAKAAEAKAAEAKAAKDSAAAAAANAKTNEAVKFAAEATRSAVEAKPAKDTVVKKPLPRAPKKPAGPAPKTPAKPETKKPEKAEKTKKK